MSGELLLEIGTEEIPARFITPALAGIKEAIQSELTHQRIGYESVVTMGTPRRLVLCVQAMAEKQADTILEALGPPEKVAYDSKGKPTKAAESFAAKQGVSLSDLELVETKKGRYLQVRKAITGQETRSLLPELLTRVVLSIPFPKSMRWADLDLRFARPVQWLLALYNGAVVPLRMAHLTSSNQSWGHRFLANRPFLVKDLTSYLQQAEAHCVIPDPKKRMDLVATEAQRLAQEAGGTLRCDEELLQEVANLVEYPVVLRGSFSSRFLDLPREVLISSMREHQRYFAVENKDGDLLPHFIVVSNNQAKDPQVVVKGNERVLSARLADARFFFDADRKVPLAQRVEGLRDVVYQLKLGSVYDKVTRLKALGTYLAHALHMQCVPQLTQAADLCKTDLLTAMVGEFPNLQGIVGREYALRDGQSPEVAHAIYEHYLPISGQGDLPASVLGSLLSIVDKIDTIVGCFGIGLIPTGTADPYALRRQALGVIRIILERSFSIDLPALIDVSLSLFGDTLTKTPKDTRQEVVEFIRMRFHHRLTAAGFSYDVVEAVTSTTFKDLVDAFERIKALQEMKALPDFDPLAVTFKRLANIAAASSFHEIEPQRFCEEEEKVLHTLLQKLESSVHTLLSTRAYREALAQLTLLKAPVDAFFEKVLVMSEDEGLRTNRLALLSRIASLFQGIADFSKIVTAR